MKPLRQACLALVLVTLCAPMRAVVAAQWGIGLDVQRSAYGGSSKDTSTSGAGGSFRPARTQALGVRFDRRWKRFAVGLGIRAAWSAGVVDAPGVFVGVPGEFKAIEVLPEVRWQVARSSRGATLQLYGGPVLGRWTFEDFGGRFVPGASGGVQGEFPIFERLSLSLRIGGSLMRSVFRSGELPPEAVPRPTRRSEIALGLRYGR